MQFAKLLLIGCSRAGRLPEAARFERMTEVLTEREGDRVVLSPTRRPSIERLMAALDDFESFPDRERPAQPDRRDSF